jgi:hypothetical protein
MVYNYFYNYNLFSFYYANDSWFVEDFSYGFQLSNILLLLLGEESIFCKMFPFLGKAGNSNLWILITFLGTM